MDGVLARFTAKELPEIKLYFSQQGYEKRLVFAIIAHC